MSRSKKLASLVLAMALLYIPQFRSVFEGIDLPWITRVLFAFSDVLRRLIIHAPLFCSGRSATA